MTNRWQLTDDVKQKYLPAVQEFIDKLESEEYDESPEIDLSDTELNPYTLQKLLESLGYNE